MKTLNSTHKLASLRISYEFMRRGGIHKDALVLLLESLPSDSALVAVGNDYESGCEILTFRSDKFPECFIGNKVPSFTPVWIKLEDGNIALERNGLEEMTNGQA